MKLTQKTIQEFLVEKLSTDPLWATRGLIRIYEFQTANEKIEETTHVINNVGFSGSDAPILSSFAKQVIANRKLTDKQMRLLFSKIKKYHRQIRDISDRKLLEKQVIAWIQKRDGLFSKV